jgi:integrase
MKRKEPRKRIRMTPFWVEKYKEPGLSPSDADSGVRLFVGTSGKKSWVWFYRHPIHRKKLIKLTMPFVSLAAARKLVADHKYLLAQSVDPVDHMRRENEAARTASEGTLNALVLGVKKDGKTVGGYLAIKASKTRSGEYYRRVLEQHVLPKLGEKQLHDLKKSEIVAMLDHVESTSGDGAADATRAVLRACLRWHQSRSDTFVSPMVGIPPRKSPKERARTRKLSDEEIMRLWHATFDPRLGMYGTAVRLLLLTGARRSEVESLSAAEIETVQDDGQAFVIWRLPERRSKNKTEIVRPLSRAAIDIIEGAPQIGDSDYIFSYDGVRPARLNNSAKKALLDEIAQVRDWVVHDTRRVFRTLASRRRVPRDVAERCLGHTAPLLDETYDRHLPLAAMLEAVEKVAAEIERIVEGEKTAKVVRLR